MFHISRENSFRIYVGNCTGLQKRRRELINDQYWDIEESGRYHEDKAKNIIEQAMKGSEFAITALEFLSRRFENVWPFWFEYAESPKWRARRRVAMAMLVLPEKLSLQLLPKLIADKSYGVRLQVLIYCQDWDALEHLPMLAERRLVESDDRLVDLLDGLLAIGKAQKHWHGGLYAKQSPDGWLNIYRCDGRWLKSTSETEISNVDWESMT